MRLFLMLITAFLLAGCAAKAYSRYAVVPAQAQRPALMVATANHRFGLYEGGEEGDLHQLLPPVHDVVKVIGGYVYVHVFEAPYLRRYKLQPTADGWGVGKAEDLPYTHFGRAQPWRNHTDPGTAVWPYVDPRWRVDFVPGFLVKADAPGGYTDNFNWDTPGEAALIAGDQILPLGRLAEQPASLHGKRWVVFSGAPHKPTAASILDLDGGLVAGPFTGLLVAKSINQPTERDHIECKTLVARTADGGWRPLDAEGRPYQEPGLVETRLSRTNSAFFWERIRDFSLYCELEDFGWDLIYRTDGLERFGFARSDLGVTTGPRWLALEHQRVPFHNPDTGTDWGAEVVLIRSSSGWLPCSLPLADSAEPPPLTPAPFAERAAAMVAATTVLEEHALAVRVKRLEQRANTVNGFEEALVKRDRNAARDSMRFVGGSAFARFYLTFGGTESDFAEALTETSDPELIAQVKARLAEMKVQDAARREADETARVAERARWKQQNATQLRADAKSASLEFDASMNGASGNGAGFDINTSDTGWFSRRAVIRERIQKGESTYEGERNAYLRTRMGEARYLEWKALPPP